MTKTEVSFGITSFIDILGFGDQILRADTAEEIEQIRRLVERIQGEFDFDTSDPLTKEVHAIYDKTVLAFSDCVVINIPLRSSATEREGTFDPILCELAGFAYAQGKCVLNKLFVRGGIDMGWWYQSGPTLISRSMLGAYRAEDQARVPVIALTQQFYDFLANHRHRAYYSSDIDPITTMLKKYEFHEKDEHIEFWYLDYISVCVEALGWQRSKAQMDAYRAASVDEKEEISTLGYRENVDDWLGQHARNIEDAYCRATSEKVKDKYRWLASYNNEIAATFTLNPTTLCVLL